MSPEYVTGARSFVLFLLIACFVGMLWQRFTIYITLTTPQWFLGVWPLYVCYGSLCLIYYWLRAKRGL